MQGGWTALMELAELLSNQALLKGNSSFSSAAQLYDDKQEVLNRSALLRR
ncbi:hypothetical protein J1TS3_03800 [Siminovitchia fordii]|uniref:Uncharacterized protein n=1 Tax=Siminovitchia fordii TaxID=254759 RepID=A0ABQ4K0G6_9BACI|nr:hypothetical protein J1TS3_03800 [Siminovitchia fordii]